MKTIFLIIFIFASFVINCFSQSYQIIGSVVDSQNQKVEYAGVFLIQNDSVLKYALTDENGGFLLEAKRGNYDLKIQQFGEILFSQTIDLDKNIDLETIAVQQTLELKEVTIVARKKLIEQKSDRLIFHVENSISAKGGNALDVLSIVPRISFNNDQLSMIGKNNVIVTVNDRPLQISGNELVNYLKSIPTDNIASIDVISNPPAKYEAQGNIGIVNIRLKTPKVDYWNTALFSSYKQSTYATGNFGGRFTYRKKNLSISSNLSYMNGSDGSMEKQTILYPNETFYNKTDGRYFSKGFSGLFGIDYQLSKRLLVGVQYSGSFARPKTENYNIGTMMDLANNSQLNLKTNLKKLSKNNNNSANFHGIYNIDSLGRKISFDVDYFNYGRNQNQTYIANDYDSGNTLIADSYSSLNNIGQQNVENYSVKIDILHPLGELKLNYGGKFSFTTTNNDIDYYDLSSGISEYDNLQSNKFRYTENNQSIYISTEKKMSEKWNMQIGLRLENTQTKGYSLTLDEEHNKNYTKLFPTAYLTYTPNNKHSFSLNYGRRISRPRFTMLNPFSTYLNPYQSVEGNPYLDPSFINNIEFGYTFINNLNATFYYSNETNGYSLITILDPNSILQRNTMLNFYTNNDYGTNVSYTFKKFKWLESYLSGNANYSVTHADYPGIPKNTEGWGASINTSNSFVFNTAKTFLGSLNLSYLFPNTYLNTKNKASFIASIGLRYIMNKNLTFNLSLRDIFKTNTQRWNVINNEILMNYYNYSDVRRITLTVSWRFGNNRINSRDSKTGNTEEKNRAN